MPELPEVETTKRALTPMLVGKPLAEVIYRRPNLRYPLPIELPELLVGRELQAIDRRAKYLLFRFAGDGAPVVIGHLGMSGVMTAHQSIPNQFAKHDHVIWRMQDGSAMVFADPRRFGFLLLSSADALVSHPSLAGLGPEPLEKPFTADYLYEALKLRRGPVKPAIMDQALVVGVGNIYASEALFASAIHPARAANRISKARITALHTAIQRVIAAAIEAGGSSVTNLTFAGKTGYFQQQLAVYGRAGEPCLQCQGEIKLIKQSGRSSFFCANCQR